jgi:hypothetical protein
LKEPYNNEWYIETYKDVATEMQSAIAVLNNADHTADEVNAAVEALQEKYDLLLAAYKDPTGVDGVEVNGFQKDAIFDISGRRVNQIAAPGLYIVNGKKQFVK